MLRMYAVSVTARRYSQRVTTRLASSSSSSTDVIKNEQTTVESINLQNDISALAATPSQVRQREVTICIPSRDVVQSGINNSQKWRVQFDTEERWENPLMGWSSNADTQSNLAMYFKTKEQAIAFSERQGYKIVIKEAPPVKPIVPKKYGDNFSWSSRTRVSTK